VSPVRELPLVLVAVGTDFHPFDRLVEWTDSWLADGGHDRAEVVVQHGSSAAPRLARGHRLLNHEELQAAMCRAAVVVCHGGPATIMEARRHGRLPVCVPRDPARGEHVDDHQLLFARRMGDAGIVRLARTESELHAALDDAIARPDRFELATETSSEPAPGLDRFAQLVGELLPPEPVQRVPVLYLGGLGRSGSTLLERALGQLDGLACVGEVVHLWERGLRDDELCGCGARFSACSFWQRVGKSAYGGWDRVSVGEVLALKSAVDRTRFAARLLHAPERGGFARRLRRYTDMLTRLYAAVLEVSGADIVVDASKHASTALVLSASPGVDLRVLHLVRDSPAVAYSWTKQIPRPEAGPGQFMATWRPPQTAMHWASENILLDRLARHGTPTHLVRYEDFARDPRSTLSAVLAFLDRPDDGHALDFVDGGTLSLDPSHTVAGNPMRFSSGRLKVVPDEAWRSALPTGQQRVVRALTLPLRGRYGYAGRRPE
jgi:UDP-N-acetylglucosamine transferase subunit ALG13